MRLSRTWSCFLCNVSRRSRTMSLTLLSDSLMTRLMKQEAADLTAAGFWVRVVRVAAASYLTAWEDAFRSSKMLRIYRPYGASATRLEIR